MQFAIDKIIFVFIGWFVRASFQLHCIQCISTIQYVSQNSTHSCQDGTLPARPCPAPFNESEPYRHCKSSLFRFGPRGSGGVRIHRLCTTIDVAQHECDPPGFGIDFDQTSDFYCSITCASNGCNWHSIHNISGDVNELLFDRTHRLLPMTLFFNVIIVVVILLFVRRSF